MKNKGLFIFFAAIAFVFVLHGIDQWLEVTYLVKSSIKIIMLFTIILFYNWKFKTAIIRTSIDNFRNHKSPKSVKYIALTLVFLIPFIYILIRPYIDEVKIIYDFENKYEITKNNFLFYGLYLSLIN